MTKRDFFIVIIKLFGLYSIIYSLFSAIPGNISFALMDIDAWSLIWIAATLIIIIGIFVLLVFKSENVVNILRLDKGFDDDRIEFGTLKSTGIATLAIFFIGGFLIIDNIPPFLSHLLFAFKGDIIGLTYKTVDKFNWLVSGFKLVLGFVLLTNYKSILKILRIKDD